MPAARAASTASLILSIAGGRARDVEARQVEIAAGRGVGVLHVDDDQRRLRGLSMHRLGLAPEMAAGGIVDGEVADGLSVIRRPSDDWQRHAGGVFISGWMRSPKILVPLTNSSKVSSTPAMPGMVVDLVHHARDRGVGAAQAGRC